VGSFKREPLTCRVADPHHFNVDVDPDPPPACNFKTDPDPAYHFNADPDPASHQTDLEVVLHIDPPSSVVDPDPELFAGSGVGSGINHFGSGSGHSGSGMNLIPNFYVKKGHFLNKMHKKLLF
jgi:hypothetical protein